MDTRHIQTVPANGAKRRIGYCRLKLEKNLQVPQCIVVTALRPDIVCSERFTFHDAIESLKGRR